MFNKQQLANEAAVAAMAERDIEDLKPSNAERVEVGGLRGLPPDAAGEGDGQRRAGQRVERVRGQVGAPHLNNQKAWRR